ENNEEEEVGGLIKKGALWGIISALVIFSVLVIFTITHWDEAKELFYLIKTADPLWIVLAITTEVLTYISAGAVWKVIARTAKYNLSMGELARLAIEQLSVNQLVPAGGIAGNVVVVKAMKRMGLENSMAMEVLFIDLLAYYIAFSTVTLITLILLFLHNHITPIILTLVSLSFITQLVFTFVIFGIVHHKKFRLTSWLKKIKLISRLFNSIDTISADRVFSTRILTETSFFRIAVFALDSLTLFFVMHALNIPTTFATAFIAVTMGSVGGAIILIPGVIGGFEAGCIGALILLGTPAGVSVACTLVFRGLSLWIPLIPGLLFARKDIVPIKINS
ncbi:flippase-like domain-containing protein, partial [Patescibacteria group bacterium]|nr:flippase-like domain-containing protein [Patescibacteria group bacterium]